ncbi:MAG: hypothetical protein K6A63_02165 [Acholeplasmatales bacterium]|nr:hypothetical protein [Acholeplasmatales bacterium]
MSNVNNGKKGDIVMLIDPITQKKQYISPSNVIIYTGTVVTDEKGNKSVGTATPKQLGVFLSEKDAEIASLTKELSQFKTSTRKSFKKLVSVLEILVGQTEVNNLDINEIIDSMEDK